jgi:hypothetical protein
MKTIYVPPIIRISEICKICGITMIRVYVTRHWSKHAMTTVPCLMCPTCKEIEVTQKELRLWFGEHR